MGRKLVHLSGLGVPWPAAKVVTEEETRCGKVILLAWIDSDPANITCPHCQALLARDVERRLLQPARYRG